MKIRTDYVTNSSSSSFILGFNNDTTVEEQIRESLSVWQNLPEEIYEKLCADVAEGEILDESAAISKWKNHLEWGKARYDVEENYRKRTHKGYAEAIDYVETEDGKKEIEEYIQNEIEKVKPTIDTKDFFVIVTYSGNDGGFYWDLECEIMPDSPLTMMIISNH